MDMYRIHSLGSGGLRLSNHGSACLDDAEAHAKAIRKFSGGGIAEVWQGARKIGAGNMPLPAEMPQDSTDVRI